MEKRKATYILFLILAIPALAVPVAAATNPVQNFANNLLLILPPVLFILSLLALRSADYEYSFTLLLAAIIVTVALAAFNGRVNSFALLFYDLHVTINGPDTALTNSPVYYTVSVSSLPAGWQVQNVSSTWLIYYNSTILVFNSSSGYINSNYINNVGFLNNSLLFVPSQPGDYLVSYSIMYIANVSGFEGIATGAAGMTLQVKPPPSGVGWLVYDIESAISNLISGFSSLISSFTSFLGQALFGVLSNALTVPIISGNEGNVVENIYYKLLPISLSLSLLFIAGSVTYNALKSNYTDLIDIASDLFYKIGVWLFFTFGGLEIYNYIASFINNLIYEIVSPYLSMLGSDVTSAVSIILGFFGLTNAIGFGFLGSLRVLAGDLVYALIFFELFVSIRYYLILAIVALIPLLATLWLFEWTKGIVGMLIDILIGLVIAGLLNTIILVLIINSDVIWIILFLPFIADLGTILSLFFSLVSLKPHESLSFSPRRFNNKSQTNQNQQTPSQPSSPSSPPSPPPPPTSPPPQKPSPITYI
jgi:hypothetical protein